MKAQFKYAFLPGLYARGGVFAVIFIMNTIFIILGSLGWLPFAAHIVAVSLCGVGIAVMFAFNIIGDIAICRRMFSAPGAYLYALTPAPRREILLASVIAMTVMDFVSMGIVITQQVWLALNLAGSGAWNAFNAHSSEFSILFWGIPLLIAGYLLMIMIILFCVTAKESIFYKKPASGFLALLLGIACCYAVSLLQLILAPFGTVQFYGLLIEISLSNNIALPAYILLTLLEAAGLFVLTSKLMERKMNI